ncbi:MAG: sensor domain-containing diguanylate cyclase [Nitrospirae bacterium]|nr:sensor domain-containing diguanylate cyclase [Nitrospirota bacterium]
MTNARAAAAKNTKNATASKTALKSVQFKEEIKQLKNALRQKERELSFFFNAGKLLTSSLEFQKVAQIILDQAHLLVLGQMWTLLLFDENTKELKFEMIKGKFKKGFKPFPIKLGRGVPGAVAKTGMPVLIPSVKNNLKYSTEIEKKILINPTTILAVPVINKKKTIGVLEMVNKEDGTPFNSKDLELILKLVDQAAIAIERSFLYQRMSDLVVTDDLTKLFNYRYLEQTLDIELRRSQRYKSEISLVFLDIDHFKEVNDTHGHQAGSQVLIELGKVLIESLRDVDIIASYGGDEFVIVLPETSVDTTHHIVKRLQKSIREFKFLRKRGLKVKLTVSFGIAGYPRNAKNKEDLIKAADNAMYFAKNSGRDQIFLAGNY